MNDPALQILSPVLRGHQTSEMPDSRSSSESHPNLRRTGAARDPYDHAAEASQNMDAAYGRNASGNGSADRRDDPAVRRTVRLTPANGGRGPDRDPTGPKALNQSIGPSTEWTSRPSIRPIDLRPAPGYEWHHRGIQVSHAGHRYRSDLLECVRLALGGEDGQVRCEDDGRPQ